MNIPAIWKPSYRGGSICYAHYLDCFIEIRKVRFVKHHKRNYTETDYQYEYSVIPEGFNIPQLVGTNRSLSGAQNDSLKATKQYRDKNP